MHARVVLGVGKGVLFREVSSYIVQECPHRENGSTVLYVCIRLSLERCPHFRTRSVLIERERF